MYNNHQSSVFTIRGDMCYENKIMANSARSVGSQQESVRLSVSQEDDNPRSTRSRRCKFRVSHIVNVIVIVIVGIVLAFIEFDVIPTKKLGYYCNDKSVSHPFRGDTISATALIVGSFLGPIVVLSSIEFRRANPRYSTIIIWKWYKELLVGCTAVLMITEVMKAVVGAPRPHFITTCVPDSEESCIPGSFVSEYNCLNTKGYGMYVVGDSSRSFPSGHTSISVFVSIFCAAFIHYRYKTRRLGQLMKPFLMTLLMTWGAVCGLTRVTDRRHHWWDVLAGAVLGAMGAIYTIVVLVKKFEVTIKDNTSTRLSTTTLIDKKNKDATSVVI